jgi:uncharacterized membrane protein YeaQ/YmgE (transglycosylase-associated protein family)
MTLENFVVWVIVGAIAGWLAGIMTTSNRQQGLSQDIVLGIVGAVIGGLLLNALGVGGSVSGVNFTSILTALTGAVILLLVFRVDEWAHQLEF